MGSRASIESWLNGVPATLRPRLMGAFEEVLKQRLGRPNVTRAVHAENLVGSLVTGRTAANAGDEFSVEHGRDAAPYAFVQVTPLVANMQTVQLTVSRDPDARRCYFTSTDEDAPFGLYVE